MVGSGLKARRAARFNRVHQHPHAAVGQAVVGVEPRADIPGVHGQLADSHVQHGMNGLGARGPVAQVVPLLVSNAGKNINRFVQPLEQDFL